MTERKIIKNYTYADYEENMNKLKRILGVKSSWEALGLAVRFTIENHISPEELEEMAANEKKMKEI